MALVDKLIQKSQTLAYKSTRSTHEKITAPLPNAKRSKRLEKSKLCLPDSRFDGEKSDHILTVVKTRSGCKYCKYLEMLHRAQNEPGEAPKVSNIQRKCVKCNVYLCSVHFDLYHTKLDDEGDASSLSATSL